MGGQPDRPDTHTCPGGCVKIMARICTCSLQASPHRQLVPVPLILFRLILISCTAILSNLISSTMQIMEVNTLK